MSKLHNGFEQLYGFLSKTFMKEHEQYSNIISKFFKRIQGFEYLFDITEDSTVLLLNREWENPSKVLGNLLGFAEEAYDYLIAEWIDDQNFIYYTKVFVEDDGDVYCITRALPSDDILIPQTKVLDKKWHILPVKLSTGGMAYIWESPKLSILEFVHVYSEWVKRYGTLQADELTSDNHSASDRESSTNRCLD
jgi:hypothetical protein